MKEKDKKKPKIPALTAAQREQGYRRRRTNENSDGKAKAGPVAIQQPETQTLGKQMAAQRTSLPKAPMSGTLPGPGKQIVARQQTTQRTSGGFGGGGKNSITRQQATQAARPANGYAPTAALRLSDDRQQSIQTLGKNMTAWHTADAAKKQQLEAENATIRARLGLGYDARTGVTIGQQGENLSLPVLRMTSGTAAARARAAVQEAQTDTPRQAALTAAANAARETSYDRQTPLSAWGHNTMASVAGINKQFYDTVDFLLPDVITPKGVQQYIDKAKEDNARIIEQVNQYNAARGGRAGAFAGSLYQSAIGMVPQAVVAIMTGGVGAAGEMGKAGAQLAATSKPLLTNITQKLAQNAPAMTSFLSTVGSDYEQAKAGGASDAQAAISAVISSALNAGIEVGGGIETAAGAPATWKNILKSMHEEGMEEVTQGIVSGLTQKSVYDHDKPWVTAGGDGVIDPARMAQEYGAGALLAGGAGAARAVGARIVSGDQTVRTDDTTNRYLQAKQAAQEVNSQMQAAQKVNSSGFITTEAQRRRVESQDAAYREQIDGVFTGNIPERYNIMIGDTPDILLAFGASNLPMTMTQSTARKIAYPVGYEIGGKSMGGSHNLGIPALKSLPEQLREPAAILQSKTQPDSLVILTEWNDTGGKPVIAALHLDKQGFVDISNEVASAYGKNNFAALVGENGENVLYTKNNKSIDELLYGRLQLPATSTDDTLVSYSIQQTAREVNSQMQAKQKVSLAGAEPENNRTLNQIIAENHDTIAQTGVLAEMTGKEFSGGERKLVDQITDFFKSIGNKVTRVGFGDVVLNRSGARDSISHGIGRNKAIAFAAVPSVIENGTVIDMQHDWKGRGYDTATFGGRVRIGGIDYDMGVIVKQYDNAENRGKYYLHEVLLTNQESEAVSFKTGTLAGYPSDTASLPENSIPQSTREVNSQMQTEQAAREQGARMAALDAERRQAEGMLPGPARDAALRRITEQMQQEAGAPRTAAEAQESADYGANTVGAAESAYTPKQKVSRVSSNTFANSGIFTEAEKETVRIFDKQGDALYDVVSEKQSLKNAKDRLDNDMEGEMRTLPDKPNFSGEDNDTAMGILSIKLKEARETGDYTEVDKWAKLIKEKGTEGGQFIQSFAKYTRTPEGIVVQGQREVDAAKKLFETTSPRKMKKLMEQGYLQWTADDMEKCAALMEQAVEAGIDTREGLTYEARAMRVIADRLPVRNKDKVVTLLMDNMLGNFKTLISRNAGGNLLFTAPEAIRENLIAAPIDKLTSLITGKRTTYFDPIGKSAAWAKGFGKGAADMARDVKEGVHTARSGESNEVRAQQKTFRNKGLGRAANLYNDFVGAMLEAGDRPFYEAAYAARMRDLERARQQGKLGAAFEGKDFDSYAPQVARQAALEAVFQNDGIISGGFQKAAEAFRLVGKGATGADFMAQAVMPFTKTPGNLAERAIEYSPLGIVKNALRTAGEAHNGVFDQQRFVNETSRNVIGSGLLYIGGELVRQGVLTGSLSDDKDEREAQKNAGMQDYAVKIGDNYVSYSWIPVIGPAIAGAADFYQSIYGKGVDTLAAIADAAKAQIQTSLFEQSSLAGIAEVFNNSGGVAEGALNAAVGITSQLVPSFIRQIAVSTDPYERQTYVKDHPLQSEINSIKAALPIFRQTLPVKVDEQGNEKLNAQGRGAVSRALENMLYPARITKDQSNDVRDELLRLAKATGERKHFQNKVTYVVTRDEQRRELSPEESMQYQRVFGEISTGAIRSLLASDAYRQMTDEQRVNAISEINSYAKKCADAQFVEVEFDRSDLLRQEAAESGIDLGLYTAYKARTDNLKEMDDDVTKYAAMKQVLEEIEGDVGLDDGKKRALADKLLIASMGEGPQEKWETLAKGRMQAGEYVRFVCDTAAYKDEYEKTGADHAANVATILRGYENLTDEQRDYLFRAYSGNMSKNPFHVSEYEQAIDTSGTFYQALTDDGKAKLRSLLNEYEQHINENRELKEWRAKAYMASKEAGIPPATYAMYRVALEAANTDGKGNPLQSEAEACVRAMDGLTQYQRAYLYQSTKSNWKNNPFGSATVGEYDSGMETGINPVEGGRVSSPFGPRTPFQTAGGAMSSSDHPSIDIAAPEGAPIGAYKSGEVTYNDWNGGYGWTIEVTHADGTVSAYHHMKEKSSVPVGTKVAQGEQIGAVGSTGNSTGPHLDLTIKKDGRPIDPATVIPELKESATGYIWKDSNAYAAVTSGSGKSGSSSGGASSSPKKPRTLEQDFGFKTLPVFK